MQISRGSPPVLRRGFCRSHGRLTGRTTRPDRAIAGPPLSELPCRNPGTDGSIPAASRGLASAGRREPADAAVSLLPAPPGDERPSARLRSEEGQDRVTESLQGTAEVARRSPLISPLRTASPTPVRSTLFPGKRTIASRVRREAIDGWRYSSDESRRKRSGSRPINHGCSVRDSRPGSSSPTLRQLRSPFGGPWPTPRVAPGAPRSDVLRTLRPTLPRGYGRVVP